MDYLYENVIKGIAIKFSKMSKNRYKVSTSLSCFTEQATASLEFYMYDDEYSHNYFTFIFEKFTKCLNFTTRREITKEEFLSFILDMHINAKAGASFGKKGIILKFTKLALAGHVKEKKEIEKKYRKQIKEYLDLENKIKENDEALQLLYKQRNQISFEESK